MYPTISEVIRSLFTHSLALNIVIYSHIPRLSNRAALQTSRYLVCLLLVELVASTMGFYEVRASSSSSCPVDFSYGVNICGNDAFTGVDGVSGGSGTVKDPYILDGSSARWISIGIFNTTRYFVIENWKSDGPSSILVLDHVANALLRNLTVSSEGLDSKHFAGILSASRNVSIRDSNFQTYGYTYTNPCAYGVGLSVSRSSGINIANSYFNGPDEGLDVSLSSNINLASSQVEGGQGGGYCGGGGAFGLGFSMYTSIRNDTFHGELVYGAWVYHDSNVVISNNTFTSTVRTGLSVFDTSSNIRIFQNTFIYNGYGLRAFGFNITVFHNNFLYNEHQAFGDEGVSWSNYYPDGGNYWSNDSPVDNCSGPSQMDCSGPDGIGDLPYLCNITVDLNCGQIIPGAFANDSYPLMKPYGPPTRARIQFNPPTRLMTDRDQHLRAYVELPLGFNASVVLSSVRLNGEYIPAQSLIVSSTRNSPPVLVVSFDMRGLRYSGVPSISEPTYQLTLTSNLLTLTSFSQLQATGNIRFTTLH
jgi:parallel beta-helix repeat protein